MALVGNNSFVQVIGSARLRTASDCAGRRLGTAIARPGHRPVPTRSEVSNVRRRVEPRGREPGTRPSSGSPPPHARRRVSPRPAPRRVPCQAGRANLPFSLVVRTNQHLYYLAGNSRGHEGLVTVDVRIVGAHCVHHRFDPRDQEVTTRDNRGDNPDPQRPFPIAA